MDFTRENIDQHVGSRIRELRERVGETPERLARTLGIEPEALAAIEGGSQSMDAYLLCRAALLFARDANYFFKGLPE